ncbi:hypothetical protein LCGC14_1572050 [marine sediment metagenome]|uniref:Uncharacterized protein n=1 Tax=marine sediment metagenome TaxID=412755 RepID=A0A0F9IJA8_9ZZZZ
MVVHPHFQVIDVVASSVALSCRHNATRLRKLLKSLPHACRTTCAKCVKWGAKSLMLLRQVAGKKCAKWGAKSLIFALSAPSGVVSAWKHCAIGNGLFAPSGIVSRWNRCVICNANPILLRSIYTPPLAAGTLNGGNRVWPARRERERIPFEVRGGFPNGFVWALAEVVAELRRRVDADADLGRQMTADAADSG